MPLRDDLLNPIPGDNPAGVNLRYDPVTDRIKEARREDVVTDPAYQGAWKTAVKTADHAAAIKMASDALVKKGKDLQIAVWLVDSVVRRDGFSAVAPCFRFLRELLEQYWDTLYPEIEDGDVEVRAAPLDWLGTKLPEPLGFLPITSSKLSWADFKDSRIVGYEADADTSEKQALREERIHEGKLSAEQFDEAADATPLSSLKETAKAISESLAEIEFLGELCDEKFGEYAPSFLKAMEALEEIAQSIRILIGKRPPEPDAEVEEETASHDAVSEENVEVSEEVAQPEWDTVSSEAVPDFSGGQAAAATAKAKRPASFGEPASEQDVVNHLTAVCRYLRANNPGDPAPYLILRSYAWSTLLKNAPAVYKDEYEPPPTEYRVKLKKLAADNDWDQVLEITEQAITAPFGRTWLDLQRYTIKALELKDLQDTAIVVRHFFREVVERIPDIIDVTLPDDTPVANAETKAWIENYVKRQTYILKAVPPPSEESSSDSGSSDFSFDTPSDTSSSDTSSSDTSSEFSFDSSSDTSSSDANLDTHSVDSTAAETPAEPEVPLEPEPFEVEENPPIIEADTPPPADTSDEFQLALQTVKDGRTEEGLRMITSILATERCGRARFRRRTQLAHLLLAAGKGKVAQPLLDQLAREIEERKLDDWEDSEAIAYPLELLFRCLSPSESERRTDLYVRICRLDPVRAVNCS